MEKLLELLRSDVSTDEKVDKINQFNDDNKSNFTFINKTGDEEKKQNLLVCLLELLASASPAGTTRPLIFYLNLTVFCTDSLVILRAIRLLGRDPFALEPLKEEKVPILFI